MITCKASIVAESAGVPIYASGGIRAVSFTNSPYCAHMHLGAVDLYPARYDESLGMDAIASLKDKVVVSFRNIVT